MTTLALVAVLGAARAFLTGGFSSSSSDLRFLPVVLVVTAALVVALVAVFGAALPRVLAAVGVVFFGAVLRPALEAAVVTLAVAVVVEAALGALATPASRQ